MRPSYKLPQKRHEARFEMPHCYPSNGFYLAAVLKTDRQLIEWGIASAYEALKRRATQLEPDEKEFQAIEQVKLKLDVLRKERLRTRTKD